VTAAAALALAVLGLGLPAAAASPELNDAQKREAVLAGQQSVTRDDFDAEWRVTNGAGEAVRVITPFHRLAAAARNAAFRNQPLKPGEPDRIVAQQAERLIFWADLRGDREDFARFYAPRLVVGNREIAPAFVQNERTALRQDGGAYVARCVYGFPIQELAGGARVTLVVRDSDGRDRSRFAIDLSRMR
jgi:hypothetical protein